MRIKQKPASGGNARNRAEDNRNGRHLNILELEANFAAIFVARRYRPASPLAYAIAVPAALGRASSERSS
jgi:hypothetical protein